MRTSKRYGVLLCGYKGFRVYHKHDDVLLIVKGRKMSKVPKEDIADVMAYVNFRYQPYPNRADILRTFEAILAKCN